MNNLNLPVALILFIFWAVEYFAFGAGSIIHILLLGSLISLALRNSYTNKVHHSKNT
ncbi:MAG: lmo0937 family membrane protein [Bacteroidia bacterium]